MFNDVDFLQCYSFLIIQHSADMQVESNYLEEQEAISAAVHGAC